MNIRRGMFRLWIVISAVWVCVVVGLTIYNAIDDPIGTKRYIYVDGPWEQFRANHPYPIERAEADPRVVRLNIYEFVIDEKPIPYYDKTQYTHREFAEEVVLIYRNTVPSAEIEAFAPEFSKRFVEPRKWEHPEAILTRLPPMIGMILMPPIGLLALGFTVAWICRGFRSSPPTG